MREWFLPDNFEKFMHDYYRFRFRKADPGTPKAALILQDTVVMAGIPAILIGLMAIGAAQGRGELNGYAFTMITAALWFYLMAKFSEDYERICRWLIVVPAAILASFVLMAFLRKNNPTGGELIALTMALGYLLLIMTTASLQLRALQRSKQAG